MDLTVARIRLFCLSAPVEDGVAMSFAPMPDRHCVVVAAETADGRTGYGESWVNYPPWASAERRATILQGLAPRVVGRDAADVQTIQADLLREFVPMGRQWGAPGPIHQAISGIDIALWDLLGRAQERSVADLLGGAVRTRVPVYASSLGPDGVADQAARCRDAGFGVVKLKTGFGTETDVANLQAAREALGPGVDLFVDANQAWSRQEAVAIAPRLRQADVRFVEEPITGDRLADLEAFHERTGLPVATGENIYGRADFGPYVNSPAIRPVQPDLSKTGGITETVAVCDEAERTGTPVAPHLYGGAVAFAATLQVAACMPAVTMVEYDVRHNPLRDPLLLDPPTPQDGLIAIPAGPGLGVELDMGALRACCEIEECYPR